MRDTRDIDNLEIITWAPNGLKLLRQLILKKAVTGKLVKQTSEEETGVELVSRILESRGLKASAENRPNSEIPQNWGRAKLGEIFHLEMGQSPNSDSYNSHKEGLPFYQGKTDFGSFVPTPRVWCSRPTKIAEAGDVLLSVRAPVGPTNYADERCCIGRGLAAVRPLGGMRTEFVLWWLRAYETQVADMGTGTTFIAVSKKNLEPFMVSIPPLSEQDRILDKINELMSLCDKLEEQISLYNALGTAARRSAVNAISVAQSQDEFENAWNRIQNNWDAIAGNPESISSLRQLLIDLAIQGQLFGKQPIGKNGFPNKWEVSDFESIGDIEGGNQPPKSVFISEPREGYVRLFQIRDLGSNPVPVYIPIELARSTSVDGEILIGRYGASVGKIFRAKSGAYNVALVKFIYPKDKLDSEFVYWTLKSSRSQSLFTGMSRSAQAGFNKRDLAPLLIPMPSLGEQQKIVEKLNSLMAICDQLENSLLKTSELRDKFARSVVSSSL